MPAISSKISHVAGFRLATLAYTQPHAVINTNLQKRIYTTVISVAMSNAVVSVFIVLTSIILINIFDLTTFL